MVALGLPHHIWSVEEMVTYQNVADHEELLNSAYKLAPSVIYPNRRILSQPRRRRRCSQLALLVREHEWVQ